MEWAALIKVKLVLLRPQCYQIAMPDWIPACAGMTRRIARMTRGMAGVTQYAMDMLRGQY